MQRATLAASPGLRHDPLWYRKAVFYEVLVRGFSDANGDGSGDFSGLIEKLDYLKWLGVDAVWLSPIYPSPMADFGYDVSDYCDIHPLFGTLADFDRLLDTVRVRSPSEVRPTHKPSRRRVDRSLSIGIFSGDGETYHG